MIQGQNGEEPSAEMQKLMGEVGGTRHMTKVMSFMYPMVEELFGECESIKDMGKPQAAPQTQLPKVPKQAAPTGYPQAKVMATKEKL